MTLLSLSSPSLECEHVDVESYHVRYFNNGHYFLKGYWL